VAVRKRPSASERVPLARNPHEAVVPER